MRRIYATISSKSRDRNSGSDRQTQWRAAQLICAFGVALAGCCAMPPKQAGSLSVFNEASLSGGWFVDVPRCQSVYVVADKLSHLRNSRFLTCAGDHYCVAPNDVETIGRTGRRRRICGLCILDESGEVSLGAEDWDFSYEAAPNRQELKDVVEAAIAKTTDSHKTRFAMYFEAGSFDDRHYRITGSVSRDLRCCGDLTIEVSQVEQLSQEEWSLTKRGIDSRAYFRSPAE